MTVSSLLPRGRSSFPEESDTEGFTISSRTTETFEATQTRVLNAAHKLLGDVAKQETTSPLDFIEGSVAGAIVCSSLAIGVSKAGGVDVPPPTLLLATSVGVALGGWVAQRKASQTSQINSINAQALLKNLLTPFLNSVKPNCWIVPL